MRGGIILPTDQELIREIKNGSQAAMEVLVKRHYKNIFAYVYRKVGDYHLAYDLTQETFIKMMKSIDKYKPYGKFQNWLLTIAVNQCRDYFRSSHFKQIDNEQEYEDYVKDEKGNISHLLRQKVESEQVRKALRQLPEFQKETIILRYYHDLKIKEIASVTDTNESTVKSRLRQGVQKLKNIFREENQNDQRAERQSKN